VVVIEHPIANQDSRSSGCDIVAMLGRKSVDRTGESDPVVRISRYVNESDYSAEMSHSIAKQSSDIDKECAMVCDRGVQVCWSC
jgi:hypothetical protein